MNQTIKLIERAEQHRDRTAIIDTNGTFSYRQLLEASSAVASTLLDGRSDLQEERVAFLVPPGFEHVAVQWGIWRAGGIAVPLAMQHPEPELAYVLDDTQASAVVVHPDLDSRLRRLVEERSLRSLSSSNIVTGEASELPSLKSSRRAMILYTSGTTSRPKGVVATHANIFAQIETLIDAWEWTADDHILHVLPLHHVHGIINVLSCALYAGAKCEMLAEFNAEQVWSRLGRGDLTLFMAVPTIYSKLIAAWEKMAEPQQQKLAAECSQLRLMVSGSAVLPVSTLEKWKSITGHTLLERYGMTEIGMALSNPLHGERVPGHVGTPLPQVEIRRVGEAGNVLSPDVPGEIEVRGPSVFHEYWNKTEATNEAFRDGWFRTGDVAVIENGSYRILGRNSVDIIKTGGFKVSALDVEEVLRTHPDIQECAVVGVEDIEWGQRVSAGLVLEPGCQLTLNSLRQWAKERLASYKVPTDILTLDELPRNAMGKVQKPRLTAMFLNR